MILDLSAIPDKQGNAERRIPCPICAKSRRDTSLGVNVSTGIYHCFRCGVRGRAAARIANVPMRIARIDDPKAASRKRERLQRVWRESVALDSPSARPVRTYLEARGLGAVLRVPPKALRAHRALEYWDGLERLGAYPALLALFRSAGGVPISIHATFLRQDGWAKAEVPAPKKILAVPTQGATKGGAIRLYLPSCGVLGIAEGVETALSLHLLRGVPVWASYCADNLARAVLPKNLKSLHIAVDVDESKKGLRSATALADRVVRESRETKVYLVPPSIPGAGDLNDELRRSA